MKKRSVLMSSLPGASSPFIPASVEMDSQKTSALPSCLRRFSASADLADKNISHH
jgi:hypothetical protein